MKYMKCFCSLRRQMMPFAKWQRPIFCTLLLGCCLWIFPLAPVQAQLPSQMETLEKSKQIAALEDQIRLAFVHNDGKTLDKGLEDLGTASPENGIFRLYMQMKEHKAKKTKPSSFKALRPLGQVSSQTLTAENMPAIAGIPSSSISLANAEEAAAAEITSPTAALLTPATGTPNATAGEIGSTVVASLIPTTQTQPMAAQTMLPATPSRSLTAAEEIAPPVASPAPQQRPLSLLASPSGTPSVRGAIPPVIQAKRSTSPTATSAVAGQDGNVRVDESDEVPFYARLLNKRVYWGVGAAAIILIGFSILGGSSKKRRAPDDANPSMPESSQLPSSSEIEETPAPEVHLNDILVNLQNDRKRPPVEDIEHVLDDTEEILPTTELSADISKNHIRSGNDETYFHNAESTQLQLEPEIVTPEIVEPEIINIGSQSDRDTLFQSGEKTQMRNSDSDDTIRIYEDQFSISDTVAIPNRNLRENDSIDLGSVSEPAKNLPADSANLQMDWAGIEKDAPKALTEEQRKTIFDEAYQRGCRSFEKQDYNAAFQHFSVAMSLRPDDPDVSSRLAMVRKALKK